MQRRFQKEFIESSYYQQLRKDMLSGYRRVGHALDNYGNEMSEELEGALQELYKAFEAVNRQLGVDYAECHK